MRDGPATVDPRFLRRALALARRAEGLTRPNPPVGAVLVASDGETVLGEGWHHRAGNPHAEVEAFLDAERRGANVRGATLYVTLEPCSTTGRTPPCTERILASSVRRVVVGSTDANPRHAGRGLALLRAAGIDVVAGILREQTDALLRPFFHWIRTGRPFVTLKMASSLDGAVADAAGNSRWISGPTSRAAVQRLRRAADAVLVGAGTALSDDPSLLCRAPGVNDSSRDGIRRIVVDSTGRLPATLRIFSDGYAERTVVATTRRCAPAAARAWRAAGATVWTLPHDADGRVNLTALLARAGEAGLLHLLCEGGGTLAGALLRARLVDELRLFVAPLALGARAASVFGNAPTPLADAPRLVFDHPRRCGGDILLVAHPLSTSDGIKSCEMRAVAVH